MFRPSCWKTTMLWCCHVALTVVECILILAPCIFPPIIIVSVCLLTQSLQLLSVSWGAAQVSGNVQVWEQTGTCRVRQSNVGLFEQPACNRLASWLASTAKVGGGGGRVFPQGLGPRDWAVLLRGQELNSWSTLCSCNLCPREPLRKQGGVERWVGQ